MTKTLGKYLTALIAAIEQNNDERDEPSAHMQALLEKETRPDVRALITALVTREQGVLDLGDFRLAVGDVPGADGWLCLGKTYGGDSYVVARSGDATSVKRLDHELGWEAFPAGADLDDLLETVIEHAHEDGETTDLDEQLGEGPEAQEADPPWELPFPGSSLKLVRLDEDLPREFLPSRASITGEKLGDADWVEAFWHGDYAFGLKNRGGAVYQTGIIDRVAGGARFVAITPDVIGESFPSRFDGAVRRLVVSARDTVSLVDCLTRRGELVVAGGNTVESVAFAGDLIAVLRSDGDKPRRLDFYGQDGANWRLRKSLACGKSEVVHSFAGDRGLVVGVENTKDPGVHPLFVLGVRGEELRLLGSVAYRVSDFISQGGKGYIATPWSEIIVIDGLDAAYDAAFAGGSEPTTLG